MNRPTLRRRTLLQAAGIGIGATLATAGADQASASNRVRAFEVSIIRRSGWGADESWRFDHTGAEIMPQAYFPTQALTVHHAVTANDDTDPAETVRAIYRYHAVEQGWGDLGYHFLIDRFGRIYEGRWSGDDPQPAFRGGRVADQPQLCNAAHVGGFNAGNLGVCLLGDFTDQLPSTPARRSLVALLAGLAHHVRLDPLALLNYVNPISGATKTVPALGAHRDWLATACPGNTFYPELADLRREVAEHL